MKKVISFVAAVSVGCLSMMSTSLYAATGTLAQLIHDASDQKLQSQRMTKAYFFLGSHIRADKARQQMAEGSQAFSAELKDLKQKVSDPAIHDLVTYEDIAFAEYQALLNAPFNADNAALMLDLSESLLEISSSIEKKLEQKPGGAPAAIVAMSGQQSVLAQRIAMYYIAYRAGFRDSNSLHQLELAVRDFETAHAKLLASKLNDPKITAELKKVGSLWKVVRKFFLDAKGGGLPVTVFATTDNITTSMTKVTRLYVARLDQGK